MAPTEGRVVKRERRWDCCCGNPTTIQKCPGAQYYSQLQNARSNNTVFSRCLNVPISLTLFKSLLHEACPSLDWRPMKHRPVQVFTNDTSNVGLFLWNGRVHWTQRDKIHCKERQYLHCGTLAWQQLSSVNTHSSHGSYRLSRVCTNLICCRWVTLYSRSCHWDKHIKAGM